MGLDFKTLVPVLLLNHGPKELKNAMTFEEGMEVGVC